MVKHRVTVDGLEMAYVEVGEGDPSRQAGVRGGVNGRRRGGGWAY